MLENILVANKKYTGKYVAMQSFIDKRVVASGKDPIKVVASAEKKGFVDTVLMFIPESDMTHIY